MLDLHMGEPIPWDQDIVGLPTKSKGFHRFLLLFQLCASQTEIET